MRRSDFWLKLCMGFVFAAIVIYIAYSFYDAKKDPLYTTLATNVALEDSVSTAGWAVRDETVLESDGGYVYVNTDDGIKVGAGQAVATQYMSSHALSRAKELYELQLEAAALQNIHISGRGDVMENVRKYAYAIGSGDLSNMEAVSFNLESAVFNTTTYTDEERHNELERVNERISVLEANSAEDTVDIVAPLGGVFSSALDGFEDVTIEDVKGLPLEKLRSLFGQERQVKKAAIGKLVTNVKWYYVTVMSPDDARKLTEAGSKGKVTMRFSKTWSGEVQAKVVDIGPEQNGRCTVILSCDTNLVDTLAIREMSAEVLFNSVEGIRVPMEAVHLDENGDSYVFIFAGLQAQKAYVDIIGENDDYYIVDEDKSELRLGTEIIVKGEGLYEGKVIR